MPGGEADLALLDGIGMARARVKIKEKRGKYMAALILNEGPGSGRSQTVSVWKVVPHENRQVGG